VDDPLLNQVFAERYRIECLIGSGGMGKVYRAVHLAMDKKVALKIMTPEAAEDPDHADRFEREAAASARLRHPNTIQLFDYGRTSDGQLYLAMEYLAGRTLAQCITAERALSPARAVHILSQVLRSLREAHDSGIIHRDLKPENIFLVDFREEPDFVKVLDFGIAKFTDNERIKKTLSAGGFVCGTPLYSAPEQALGYRLTPAADIYALGVILYEMLCGIPPFKGADAMTTVMMHVHMPPELPAHVRSATPEGLSSLLLAMLDKAPSRRPASATDLLKRLAAIGPLSDEPVPVPSPAPMQTTEPRAPESRAASESPPPATVEAESQADLTAAESEPTQRLPQARSGAERTVRPVLTDLLTILAVILLIGLATLLLLHATRGDPPTQTPTADPQKQESPTR
jgi:serine/threonine-protein kinase